MAVKTLSDAAGVLFNDRRDFYIKPMQVAELYASATPFISSLFAKGPRKTTDPDYKMFEHRAGWRYQHLTVNDAAGEAWDANAASSSTAGAPHDTVTAIVDGATGVLVDDSLEGRVVEIWDTTETTFRGVALIHDVSSSGTTSGTIELTSLGNPTASDFAIASLVDNDKLYVVGSAFGEGTTAPEAFSDELEVVHNSSQIFKTSVEVTGTLYEAALRGYSNELARLRLDKMNEQKIQIERTFWMGMRTTGIGGTAYGASSTSDTSFVDHVNDAGSKKVRTTMGVIPALRRYGRSTGDQQNVFSIVGETYKYATFVDHMEKIFQYNPSDNVKTAYCGPSALSYWSKMSNNSGFVNNSGWTVQVGDSQKTTLGYNYRMLETPHGLLRLVPTPLFRGPYAGYMVVISEPNVDLVQYRPSKFQANIKTEDAYDGYKDTYFFDGGLGLELVEEHSLWIIS